MKNRFTASLVALVAAVGLMTQASAGIIMNVEQSAAGGLVTYILNFTSDDGNIAAFEGLLVDGEQTTVGFLGNLSQQLVSGVIPTPTTDFNVAIDPALDSQFLLATGDTVAVVAPYESQTTLGGQFGIAVPSRAPSLDLIQIVAPVGEVITYNFLVGQLSNDGIASNLNFSGDLVPEPTSIALACLGLMGVVLGSRRRS